MLTVKIHIDDKIRRVIKSTYGKDDYATVDGVVGNIINRYLDAEYFDPELLIDDNNYKICESCGEKSKSCRVVSIDEKNLEEHNICENCGSGYPILK